MAKKKPPTSPAAASPAPGSNDDTPLANMLAADYDGPKVRAAVDLSTRAGKRIFLNAQSQPTFLPEQLRGKVFRLVSWLAERRTFHDDETQEDRLGVSIVMIDPKGQTCRFGSEAIVRFIDSVRQMYGNGPYASEPIFLRIEKVTTRKGRQSYSVQEVDPDDVTKDEQTW